MYNPKPDLPSVCWEHLPFLWGILNAHKKKNKRDKTLFEKALIKNTPKHSRIVRDGFAWRAEMMAWPSSAVIPAASILTSPNDGLIIPAALL